MAIIGTGKFLRLISQDRYEFVERVNARGVVAIVAVTADRRLVLTEQFRRAVGKPVIDLPAGLAGDVPGQRDEPLSQSALRELMEETGYRARSLRHAIDCPSSPGLTSEVVSFFVARGLTQVDQGGGVDNEKIVVHRPTLRSISRWLKTQINAGKLIDTKVYAALYLAGA